MAVELDRLELERSCWSWSGVAGVRAELLELKRDPSAHGKVRSLFLFLACLLQRNKLVAASSGARLRSLRCFLATQQAPEPSSGACVTFLQRSKLRSQAPKLALRCFAATQQLQQVPEPGSGACCGLLVAATQQAPECESLLLQHSKLRSLLQLNPATQQALERLLQ